MENREQEQNQDEYIQELMHKAHSSRKFQYCCDCCVAYWIASFLAAFLGAQAATDQCKFLGNTAIFFAFLCSIACILRIIDGIMIVCSCAVSCGHCSSSYHKWLHSMEYTIGTIFLLLLTIFWFFFETCEGFRTPVMWLLIVIWLIVLIWHCCIKGDDDE